MTSQELETSLLKGKLPTVCCLYGEETFLVERATRLLLGKAIDDALRDFNLNVFYGNEVKGTEIVDAAQTLPMFAERRAVVVKRADALKAEAMDLLLSYVQQPSPGTCLILIASKVDQRKKLFQELKKQGALVEYKRLYDNKIPAFVQSEAQVHGKPIEPPAAELLSFLIGNNLQELSSQIEKLAVYAGTRPRITLDDVRTMASSSKAFTVFELARYLGSRDLQNALRSLDTLFRGGEEVPVMIGALSRHFRQLWRVRELVEQKAAQADISREVGINNFFVGEYIQQARNFNRGELQRIFDELYRCDVASKSGGVPYTLMHGLVMLICARQA